jgi:hypothetical protein
MQRFMELLGCTTTMLPGNASSRASFWATFAGVAVVAVFAVALTLRGRRAIRGRIMLFFVATTPTVLRHEVVRGLVRTLLASSGFDSNDLRDLVGRVGRYRDEQLSYCAYNVALSSGLHQEQRSAVERALPLNMFILGSPLLQTTHGDVELEDTTRRLVTKYLCHHFGLVDVSAEKADTWRSLERAVEAWAQSRAQSLVDAIKNGESPSV